MSAFVTHISSFLQVFATTESGQLGARACFNFNFHHKSHKSAFSHTPCHQLLLLPPPKACWIDCGMPFTRDSAAHE